MTQPRPQGEAEVECGQNPASSAMGLQDSWLGTSFNTVPSPDSAGCWQPPWLLAELALTGQLPTETLSLPRSAGPDDRSDHGRPHELTHLHLQQQQYPVCH